MLLLLCARAEAADITVDFTQSLGTQSMQWGTNEVTGQLNPSTVASSRLADINSMNIRLWIGGGIRPGESNWNWSVLDDGVTRILGAGATPMICFAGIPDWMAETPYPGKPDTWNHPRDLTEWGNYCVSIVAHAASQGHPVDDWYWEIWNEPNNGGVSGSWSTNEYLELYDAAAIALRANFPNLRIGGPSVDHPSEHWIKPLLDGHDVQFITWHRYGAWDPNLSKSSSSYLSETYIYGDHAALVKGWIEEIRPGEGILNVCGEINLNAYCCPIDSRIWEPMLIPWYTSVMNHLMRNGCDVEQFFVGTDKSWPNYGLFLGTGADAGLPSPAFMAKELFTSSAPVGSTLVSTNSNDSDVEVLATSGPDQPNRIILIHKSSGSTPVTVNVTGPNVTAGVRYTVDANAYNAGSYATETVGGGQAQSMTLNGYALEVVELCVDGELCAPDLDTDGILNALDNCPEDWNPNQADTDGDGPGDACDACPLDPLNDADQDTYCGSVDNCPAIANADQADGDEDTIGDACDNCPETANLNQQDTDLDGVGNACDLCPSTPIDAFVSEYGCPTSRADFDRDGDVDMEDFGRLQACISGSGIAQDAPDCLETRLDADDDIDEYDVSHFRDCLSGVNIAADPACDP